MNDESTTVQYVKKGIVVGTKGNYVFLSNFKLRILHWRLGCSKFNLRYPHWEQTSYSFPRCTVCGDEGGWMYEEGKLDVVAQEIQNKPISSCCGYKPPPLPDNRVYMMRFLVD